MWDGNPKSFLNIIKLGICCHLKQLLTHDKNRVFFFQIVVNVGKKKLIYLFKKHTFIALEYAL